MVSKFLFMALLAPLACGGGGPNPNPTGDPPVNDPGDNPGNPAALLGTLHTVVGPAITGAQPVRLRLDGTMMPDTEIVPGSELAVEVEAGTHTVGLVCPDYCWATAVGNWTSQGESCGAWELDVEVPANDTTRLDATLCRDLTGRWQSEVRGALGEPTEVHMRSENGTCTAAGMDTGGLEVLGDQVNPGGGEWFAILDNGTRIEYGNVVLRRLE